MLVIDEIVVIRMANHLLSDLRAKVIDANVGGKGLVRVQLLEGNSRFAKDAIHQMWNHDIERTKSMAKKETKTTATAATPGANAPKVTIERGLNDRFVRIKKDGKAVEVTKGAPQLKVIVNAVEAAGAKGLTREELVKNLTGVLVTRQPVGRIVSYYQKAMVEGGYIAIEKAATPAPAEAAAK